MRRRRRRRGFSRDPSRVAPWWWATAVSSSDPASSSAGGVEHVHGQDSTGSRSPPTGALYFPSTNKTPKGHPRMETRIGAVAPDFTLAAHNTDQKISLANYRGRPVVVAFMPFAFTGG